MFKSMPRPYSCFVVVLVLFFSLFIIFLQKLFFSFFFLFVLSIVIRLCLFCLPELPSPRLSPPSLSSFLFFLSLPPFSSFLFLLSPLPQKIKCKVELPDDIFSWSVMVRPEGDRVMLYSHNGMTILRRKNGYLYIYINFIFVLGVRGGGGARNRPLFFV